MTHIVRRREIFVEKGSLNTGRELFGQKNICCPNDRRERYLGQSIFAVQIKGERYLSSKVGLNCEGDIWAKEYLLPK